MMLSTSSHCQHGRRCKAASGPLWFQLYHRGYEITQMLVRRAEDAGFKAVVLTVDTPLPAPKERDIRNRYENPFPPANFRVTPDAMAALERHRRRLPTGSQARVPALAWKELDWLRSLTSLPLVLQGRRMRRRTRTWRVRMRRQWHPGVDAWRAAKWTRRSVPSRACRRSWRSVKAR